MPYALHVVYVILCACVYMHISVSVCVSASVSVCLCVLCVLVMGLRTSGLCCVPKCHSVQVATSFWTSNYFVEPSNSVSVETGPLWVDVPQQGVVPFHSLTF